MKHSKSSGISLMLLLSLLLCANALAVKVSLSSDIFLEEVYPGELIPTRLVIENDSNTSQRVFLSLASSEEVFLRSAQEISALDYTLGPGEEILLSIDALTYLRALPGEYFVRADFGEKPETLNYSYSMTFTLTESPLQISSKLQNSAMDELEDNKIRFSLKNLSQEPLTDIKVTLSVPQGIKSDDSSLSLGSLAGRASLENQFIGFYSEKDSYGNHSLVLTVDFVDSKGSHSINQAFDLKVRNKFNLVAIVVGLIVVLIALNFFTKKQAPKPKPSPKKEKKKLIKKGTIEVPTLKEVKSEGEEEKRAEEKKAEEKKAEEKKAEEKKAEEKKAEEKKA